MAQQQTLSMYNLSNALESLTSNALITQVKTSTGGQAITTASVTALTPTTVQVDACLAGSYSGADAQTCTLCPAGKYSAAITATSSDTCVACGPGKYSNTTGAGSAASCVNCPANTYYTGSGGASVGVCVACPAFSGSYEGAPLLQWCVCLPGYSGPNGAFRRVWRVAGVCLPDSVVVMAGGGGRRALLYLQHVRVVPERAGEPLPTQLQRERGLVKPRTVPVQAGILRGHYHVGGGLSHAVSGMWGC